MKYIDAEKLIAEIEWRKNESRELAQEHKDSSLGIAAETMANEDEEILSLIASLQQEQPELPQIGYAETYYQKGLHDGIIKGQMEILKWLEEIEKRKAEPVLVIKEQEQPEVDLEKEIKRFLFNATKMNKGEWRGKYPISDIGFSAVARHFYKLGLNARNEE